MLIDLMHEELYMRGIRKNLESYVQELETTLNQVNLEEGQAEALFTLDEKDKSRIGSYFSAMFEGKCIHKIPFPRIGIVTTENVTD